MDSLYRDVLREEAQQASLQDSERETHLRASHLSTHRTVPDQTQYSQTDNDQSKDTSEHHSELHDENSTSSDRLESSSQTSKTDRQERTRPAAPTKIEINQPIGSLCGAAGAGSGGPLTVRGEIETITDEEILQNRESEEGIRSIPRFRNYQAGKPSKVSTATSSCIVFVVV